MRDSRPIVLPGCSLLRASRGSVPGVPYFEKCHPNNDKLSRGWAELVVCHSRTTGCSDSVQQSESLSLDSFSASLFFLLASSSAFCLALSFSLSFSRSFLFSSSFLFSLSFSFSLSLAFLFSSFLFSSSSFSWFLLWSFFSSAYFSQCFLLPFSSVILARISA